MVSLTGKQWHIQDQSEFVDGKQLLESLVQNRHLHATVGTQDLAASTSAKKAAERIWQAINNNETVYIFGDYDCDGVTSLAQLLRFFLRHGLSPIAHAPHRIHEGYGLQMGTVQKVLESKATLLITVDTGITSVEEVRTLQEGGVDVIITDHHHLPEVLPPAFAIVHPEHSLLQSEWKPAGAGVVYNLLLALEKEKNWSGKEYDQILAMIGTVGDIVPLTYANRTLVIQGLQALKSTEHSPLHDLCSALELDVQGITSTDIAFRIVPHINAAGRLSDPTIALRALMGESEFIQHLIVLNTQRKQAVNDMITLVEEYQQTQGMPHLVAYSDPAIHHGILGLIAGRMTEQTGLPSIIATSNTDGTMSASLRSPTAYNVVEGLTRNADVLLRFGGHSQAAGCTFTAENAQELFSALHADVESHASVNDLVPTVTATAVIDVRLVTLQFVQQLQSLEPFGCQNEAPTFVLKNQTLQNVRWIGAEGQHVQAMLGSTRLIGFNAEYLQTHEQAELDVLVKPRLAEWQGTQYAELQLMDAKLANS